MMGTLTVKGKKKKKDFRISSYNDYSYYFYLIIYKVLLSTLHVTKKVKSK